MAIVQSGRDCLEIFTGLSYVSQSSMFVDRDHRPLLQSESIAVSSAEAEHYRLASGLSQGLLFKVAFEFFNFGVATSASCDSRSARVMDGNTTQHLDVREPWVLEISGSGVLKLLTIVTDSNKADLGTKPLQGARLNKGLTLKGLEQNHLAKRNT